MLAALLAPLGLASTASAHMGSTKYVDATVSETVVELDVAVESIDAAVSLGLGTEVSEAALQQHGRLISGWLARGLTVQSETGRCTPSFADPTLSVRDGKSFVALDLAYDCGIGAEGLSLRDDTVFDDDPDHEVFVSVTDASGTQAHVLRAGAQSVDLSAEPRVGATASAFVREGATHLVTGYDHLLFLLSLILIASLAVPRDGVRAAMRDVGLIVTAFTIGHSISLAAAALDWIRFPSQFIEAAIAASIVLVAGLNVARPEAPTKKTLRRRIALASGFGLIHGFGFSSVLAEVGLPLQHRLVALASFNVGIELAQLAFVAAVLLPLAWMSKSKRYPAMAVQGGSLAIAALGCVWLVERSLGL